MQVRNNTSDPSFESFEDMDTLIPELNKGNQLAYKYLYTKFYNELCVFAVSFVKDNDIAEDLVQSVMIKLWNLKPNIKINTSVRHYLYRAVRNAFISYYRKTNRELNNLEELKIQALEHFENESTELIEERLLLIKDEIDKLPEKCKEVFILNKVNGLKYKEVADELEISTKTVEAHVRKALILIKKRLDLE